MRYTAFSKIIASFMTLMVMSGLLQLAHAAREDEYLRSFFIGETEKRLYLSVREFDSVSDDDIERWKVLLADWAEEYWRAYEDAEFKSPANGTDPDGVETLHIFYREADGVSGSTSTSGFLRVSGGALGPSRLNTLVRSSLSHEIFHSVQYRYSTINQRYGDSFREGTGKYSSELVNADVDRLVSTGRSCASEYLANPGGRLWFRPGGAGNANVCHTVLWWKYLTQQFSSIAPADIKSGIDTLARLLDWLEPNTGWRQRRLDQVAMVSDLNGNGLDDLLVTSDQYIGVISPMFYNPTTHDVVLQRGRLGENGWKFAPTDRVLGACDFTGNGRAEFLIASEGYFGMIALDEKGRFQTVTAKRFGVRFGPNGWPISRADEVVGTGDFDGDGKCEFLVKNATQLGLIEFQGGGFKTLTTHSSGAYFDGGWRLSASDVFPGIGDFNGDGRDDFMIRSSSYYGFIAFNPESRSFDTITARNNSFSIAQRWQVTAGSQVIGAGRFSNMPHDSVLLYSTSGVIAISATRAEGIRLDGAIPHSQMAQAVGQSNSSFLRPAIVADMNGDGQDDFVLKLPSGALFLFGRTSAGGFSVIANAPVTEELNDGFNGNRFRPKWQPQGEYSIAAVGDLNGDLRDELFIRDRNRTIVLKLGGDNSFIIGEIVTDNERFDSLIGKLDSFIEMESNGARNLHSMFTDFSVANYLSGFQSGDIGDRYKYTDEIIYPNSIDFDKNPATPPVVFETETRVNGGGRVRSTQQPWTTHYFKFDTPNQALSLGAQFSGAVDSAVLTVLVVDGPNLFRKVEIENNQLSEFFDMARGRQLILIVTSFEAPLEYVVSVEDR